MQGVESRRVWLKYAAHSRELDITVNGENWPYIDGLVWIASKQNVARLLSVARRLRSGS